MDTSPIELPWAEAYLAEHYLLRSWFISGEYYSGAVVDISDGEQDVFIGLPGKYAKQLIDAREAFVEQVHAINAAIWKEGFRE